MRYRQNTKGDILYGPPVNRPALVLFIDFLSAFDKMWYPSLMMNRKILGLPTPLLKWIYNWLQQRTLSIHFGEVSSRTIPVYLAHLRDRYLQPPSLGCMCISSLLPSSH